MQNRLTHQVLAYMREQNMLQSGEGVLVAVSGGADSMCLLHLLWDISQTMRFSVSAATFDHQIRPEGASDAEFVADWCQERGIPCVKGSGNVPQYAREHHLGLEEAARILRYAFLRTTASERHCSKIATAHNANDNAETVLLHLVRGSGLNGLGGIRPVHQEVIRPILCCTRREIEAYLMEHNLPHVEDATNADTAYRRNYLRHEVLPRLMEQNPGLLEGLLRSGESLRADEEYLSQQAEKLVGEAEYRPNQILFSAERFRAVPDSLFFRVAQRWAEVLSPQTVLSSRQRTAIKEACHSQRPSAVWMLPDGLVVRREYNQVILERRTEQAPETMTYLSPGQEVVFGNRRLSCSWAECPGGKFNQPHQFYLKPPEQPLLLRPRRTGDEITLPSRNRKTVKKLLIDSKIPKECRAHLAVLESGGMVAALDGFGVDIVFLPQKGETCWRISSSESSKATERT